MSCDKFPVACFPVMTIDTWAETRSPVYRMQPSAGPGECSGGAWRTGFVASAEGWRAGTKSLPARERPALQTWTLGLSSTGLLLLPPLPVPGVAQGSPCGICTFPNL